MKPYFYNLVTIFHVIFSNFIINLLNETIHIYLSNSFMWKVCHKFQFLYKKNTFNISAKVKWSR